MVFHSPNFLIFMILLLIPYYLWQKGRIGLLLAASVIFYAASGLGVLLLFVAVTFITFCCVRLMLRPGFRWMFWVGIAVNVANLGYFKYTLMLLNTVEKVIGRELLLTELARGWLTDDTGHMLLPIGISFYTFQFISYLIDVRRGTIEATRNFFRLWMYVIVFPHLMAGPIMRGGELIPQLDRLDRKDIRWQEIRFGLYMIFVGLIKKIVIADNLAAIVNPLFADAAGLNPEEAWIAAYTFGFQIYFDFSAYSDMALGLGYLLGFKLIVNFKTPYLSASPSEFWERWHISLSRWIRDYIYIGLGGNRKGAVRTYVNLLAAMLISGLWHGAAWHFVVWGGVHGLLLILYKWTLPLNRIEWVKMVRSHWLYRIFAVAAFFHIVTWTWVFFRAESLREAWHLTKTMAHVDVLSSVSHPLSLLVAGLFALHVLEHLIRSRESQAERVWHRIPAPLRGAVYAALIFVMFYFMKGETYDFIYFNF